MHPAHGRRVKCSAPDFKGRTLITITGPGLHCEGQVFEYQDQATLAGLERVKGILDLDLGLHLTLRNYTCMYVCVYIYIVYVYV